MTLPFLQRGGRRDGDAILAMCLFAAAVALRAAEPMIVGGAEYDALFAPASEADPYRIALRTHPFGYLWYNHVVPPLFTIKNVLLHTLLAADWVRPAQYGALVLADAAAAAFAFLFMRHFGLPRLWAAIVALLVSLRLLPWEAWGWGGGWDAFNPFLVLLYAWSMVRFMLEPTAPRGWTAAACGTLLILSFQFGLPIVAVSVLGAAILLLPQAGCGRPLTVVALLPVIATVTVVGKNAWQHDLWSMSSGVGQNVFQNLNLAIVDPEGRGALKLGKRNGYPAWWSWCYEEAERRNLHPTENVAGFYGMCMMTDSGERDFGALQAWLAAHPDPETQRVVEKDIAIARNRSWLWDGPVGDRATGTQLEYGKISQRLLGDVIAEYPRNFAGRFYMNLTEHFLWVTWHFLVDIHPGTFELPPAVRFMNRLAGPLFPVGFAAACVFFAVAAVRRIVHFFRPVRGGLSSARPDALGLVGAGFLSVAVLSAALACCENYRHAFCYLPVAMCLAAVVLYDTAVAARRITQNRRFRYE